jgi:aspartyl-tRNA(Asn)/glutamyl-tRNA(Gln) amidotransferase subunit B
VTAPPFEAVIGLEVHAQIATATKMFCGCSTRFGAPPNSLICPVCTGMPGTLPAVNRAAVERAVRLGLALGAKVHRRSVFARKNYFYPDLPKGYQISQFDQPLCEGGAVPIETDARGARRIRLTRIHLEEDAGQSTHLRGRTLVDLNRAGVPLCEVVSEPDMRSPAEAIAWMKSLRSVLRYLDVSDGNMEEGSFRCDANVSVRPVGALALGTKVEVKNLNSFRFVGQALEHEIARQVGLVQSGGEVRQETRRFDSRRGVTVRMRGKEDAHDYRYFPEPDLPPLVLDEARIAELGADLPELPDPRAQRYQRELGIPAGHAEVLVSERGLADWFEAAVALAGPVPPPTLASWTISEVLRLRAERGPSAGSLPLAPGRLVQVVALVESRVVTHGIGKQLLDELWDRDVDPAEIVRERGWQQVDDGDELSACVRRVLAANPAEVARYRAGHTKLLGWLLGQVMREMGGRAEARRVTTLLQELLEP